MSFTVQEVAGIVNVSPQTVRNAIARGDLEAWRPSPKTIRIEQDALDAWRKSKPSATVRKLRAVK